MKLKSPVAFFVYNRPEVTQRTLNAIRSYAPNRLFVISDGPKDHSTDIEAVNKVRAICDLIDWPCQVSKLYFPQNLGCRNAITTGFEWIFDLTEDVIILEDDCLPHQSFFDFCTELLVRYRHTPEVMTIGGYSPINRTQADDFSYFFSKYPITWGWATWRRAYNDYNPTLPQWSETEGQAWLANHLGSDVYAKYWSYMFTRAQKGSNDWDYAWIYHCWLKKGLSIRPNVSMISNIGFGPDATHTKETDHPFGHKPALGIQLPLKHPEVLECSAQREIFLESLMYSGIRQRQIELIRNKISEFRLINTKI